MAEVKIFPGDVTIETAQDAVFTAIAYDKDDTPISGLNVQWSGLDEDKNQAISISPRAVFNSAVPGKYKITADIAGHKAHVRVTVIGLPRLPNITRQASAAHLFTEST